MKARNVAVPVAVAPLFEPVGAPPWPRRASLPSMTARTSRTRPPARQRRAFGRLVWLLWPGLVALVSLGFRPSFCLLQEASAHGGHHHTHHAARSLHHSGIAHQSHGHDEPDSAPCCSDDEPAVLALASSPQGLALLPIASPSVDILAVLRTASQFTLPPASWRGRDGPSPPALCSLFSPLCLPGRSPPLAVAL